MRALFARLTNRPKRGAPLFDAAVAEARRTHWFADGAVPDSVEGRFAVLATVVALILVRLEAAGEAGERLSVALTERFIETLDSEIREMGVGDPALGRQVRALVGALATRVERWREAIEDPAQWEPAVQRSLYRGRPVTAAAQAHGTKATRELWERIGAAAPEELAEGSIE